MELPDLTGTAGTPGNGPFMILSLRVGDRRITAAKFQTYGCGPTIASGSMLTEMIIGRTNDVVLPVRHARLGEATGEQLGRGHG